MTNRLTEVEVQQLLDRVLDHLVPVIKLVYATRLPKREQTPEATGLVRELMADAVAAAEIEHMASGVSLWVTDLAADGAVNTEAGETK